MDSLEALSYMQSLGIRVDEASKQNAAKHSAAKGQRSNQKRNRRSGGQPLIDPGMAISQPQTFLTVSGDAAAAELSSQRRRTPEFGAKKPGASKRRAPGNKSAQSPSGANPRRKSAAQESQNRGPGAGPNASRNQNRRRRGKPKVVA